MFIVHRTVVPGINALFVTVGLLLLMYQLVKIEEPQLLVKSNIKLPPISMAPKDEELKPIVPQPIKIIEAEVAPEIIADTVVIDIEPIDGGLGPITYTPPKQKGLPLPENTQLVLMLGVPPVYPRHAITQGLEGYAIVGFSIAASGSVYDAFIIESEPRSVFDKSALNAIQKFKYNPKIVNGKAVAVDGQQYQFTYQLDDS